MKKYSLSIDTSGRLGSVALSIDDKLICEKYFSDQMRHTAELLPTINDMLENNRLKASNIGYIFVTKGPGSFTGLRIGLTFAKMMALAGGVKIATVSSLDCTMMNATKIPGKSQNFEQICVVTDAKRGQFFSAIYAKDGETWKKTMRDSLIKPSDIMEKIKSSGLKTVFLGEGLKYYQDKFTSELSQFLPEEYWAIKASAVFELAWEKAQNNIFDDAKTLVPSYLRLSDAEENLIAREAR